MRVNSCLQNNYSNVIYQYNHIINGLKFKGHISANMNIANKSASFIFCSRCKLINAVLVRKNIRETFDKVQVTS